MKRWRNGLAVASVIWWHNRPLWAFPRMRSDARGYPWWPGTQTFRSRAGYRSARPITSKSSLSACNARPVHTVGSDSTELPRRYAHQCPLSLGCEQSQQAAPLLDHLVGAGEKGFGNRKADRFRGFDID